ncbi:hypothetical protein HD554DRAFT_2039106 [Boletus coccyginus]|nr:hypothetical protein HD554DRAFT_2039106 [Boletus coccyginus]
MIAGVFLTFYLQPPRDMLCIWGWNDVVDSDDTGTQRVSYVASATWHAYCRVRHWHVSTFSEEDGDGSSTWHRVLGHSSVGTHQSLLWSSTTVKGMSPLPTFSKLERLNCLGPHENKPMRAQWKLVCAVSECIVGAIVRSVGLSQNRECPTRPEKNEQDSGNRTMELPDSIQDGKARKKKKSADKTHAHRVTCSGLSRAHDDVHVRDVPRVDAIALLLNTQLMMRVWSDITAQ